MCTYMYICTVDQLSGFYCTEKGIYVQEEPSWPSSMVVAPSKAQPHAFLSTAHVDHDREEGGKGHNSKFIPPRSVGVISTGQLPHKNLKKLRSALPAASTPQKTEVPVV